MRQLNIDEIEEKIDEYALDVEYIDGHNLVIKINQFLNFLLSQRISKRILERIETDFKELKDKIPKVNTSGFGKKKRKIISEIETPEQQEALGYFLIMSVFKSNKISPNSYLELTYSWYNSIGDYDEWKNDFNSLLFKPFMGLLKWYIYESQSCDSEDYFSRKEITEYSEKLDQILKDIRLGQEIIFDEIEDLKEQLKNQKKKNWVEILKGKLLDLAISKGINEETISFIYKTITGHDFNYLN